MIIQIGNTNLMPWIHIPYEDRWIRYVEYGTGNRVDLEYDKFAASWQPLFCGNCSFLKAMFDQYGQLDKHKYKHHLKAQEQMDRFLIRMGKLTSFL